MFINKQPKENKEDYFKLLQAVGSLSVLFSDSNSPYLYYRAAERIFCKAFKTDDLAREDSSFDAKKDKLGIGLKTFLYKNGSCIEKVAEFNSKSDKIREIYDKPEDIVSLVSELRNKRIKVTLNTHNLDNAIYHCVTRNENKFSIYECPLDFIDLNKIKKVKKNRNTINFEDNVNEYSFSLAKNTLFKRFNIKNNLLESIDVPILDDPFSLLYDIFNKNNEDLYQNNIENIILPLYSERSDEVQFKSGLNQWNASGRKRNENEVYIPIPQWIHKKFPEFFPVRDICFDLELPDGKVLSAKLCQDNSKALMSSPNKDLGKWILRDVLELKEGQICTMNMLEDINIDSVLIEKIDIQNYKISFLPFGSFKEFSKNNNI